MLKLNDHRNFRRTAAGLALIIGPLLLLINSLITTMGGGDDQRAYLAEVAKRRGAEEASAVIGIFGFVLVALGILGALKLLRRRGVVLGHIGGLLAVLGMLFFLVLLSSSFYDVAATAPGVDTNAYVRVSESIEDRVGPIIILAVALLGTLIGLVLLAIAFFRARTVPVWVGPLLIVGIILVFVSEDSRVLSALASLALLGAFGTVGVQLLKMSDEEWERPGLDPGARTAAAGPAGAADPSEPRGATHEPPGGAAPPR